MPIEGEYEPSPASWVRDQVEEYERSGGHASRIPGTSRQRFNTSANSPSSSSVSGT